MKTPPDNHPVSQLAPLPDIASGRAAKAAGADSAPQYPAPAAPPNAVAVARKAIVGEQNILIAKAYAGLLMARKQIAPAPVAHEVLEAIAAIEDWRQRRDPS